MAKESFIKGTLIIAAATLIARALGLFQRVPLENMLGSVGNAAFAASQTVYLMLLAVATAGIPSTLSKIVSERYALNNVYEAERVYYAALLFGLISGLTATILLIVFAGLYAQMIQLPEAAPAIRMLAPSLLLFPVIAMMRGYTQGRNMMQASGVSQIMEQILRVVTAIGLAYLLMSAGQSQQWTAAGASFGGVAGSCGAFIVMIHYSRKLRQADKKAGVYVHHSNAKKVSLRAIFRSIFVMSVPIVLSALAVPAVNFIDTSITIPLLSPGVGIGEAKHLYGILGQRAQSIAGIPPILAIALSTSLMPVISAAFAKHDIIHLTRQTSLAMRISVLSGMPIALVLSVAAYSVNGLLFSSLDGAGIIAALTIGTIFQITMITSNSILIGIGKSYIAMISVILGIIFKLIISFSFVRFFGIYGIISGTALSFLLVTWLNLRVMKKIVPFFILGKRWTGFLLTIILSGTIGYAIEWAGEQLIGLFPAKLIFMLTVSIVGIIVIILFVFGLVAFRVIGYDELSNYPRPMQKMLHRLMRLQGERG